MCHLIFETGPNKGQLFTLERPTTVLGKSNTCDIVLESDLSVSRRHAVISRMGDDFYIADGDGNGKASRNHTFVNDVEVPVPGRVLLKHRDIIRIREFTFIFFDSHADAATSDDSFFLNDLVGRWAVTDTWEVSDTTVDYETQNGYFEFGHGGGGQFLLGNLHGQILACRPKAKSKRGEPRVEWIWRGVVERDKTSPAITQFMADRAMDSDNVPVSRPGLGWAVLRSGLEIEGAIDETGFVAKKRPSDRPAA
jgi:hypothetical protein